MVRCLFLLVVTGLLSGISSCSQNDIPKNTEYTHEIVVNNLSIPWGFTFLPDGSLLISEKEENLFITQTDKEQKLLDYPKMRFWARVALWILNCIQIMIKMDGSTWHMPSPVGSGSGANTALIRFKINNGAMIDRELLYKSFTQF